ncbi:MAG TPA: DUF4446 family protein [Jatrophihabitans sp.]|nr:DUF4446 family protein [Jatrophihabitans sp.]
MSDYVAIFALVLAYVAFVAAYLALRTLAKVRRATAVLARGTRGPEIQASLLEATQRNTEQTEILAEELAGLRDKLGERRESPTPADHGPAGLTRVALVRYDALREMSGRMSFSLALLDEHGDGVTISAISGQADTRVYAKCIANGRGEHELSPEEQQAVSSALARRRGLLGRKSA